MYGPLATIESVSALELSPQRRNELAALLGDQTRLRAEYPKVAEYLATAPMLSGTDNAEADAAFDLRFVHYLTGGATESANPYWEIVGPAVGIQGERRVVNGGCSRGSTRLAFAQTILQSVYAYAVPAPRTLDWVAELSTRRTVFELGAGRGYWAKVLADRGVAVRAFDSEPPDTTTNASFPGAIGQRDVWFQVDGSAEFEADLDDDSVLLLCWPPGWGNPMASAALELFERRGGHHLIYVGEPKGGNTGDEPFFDRLSRNWLLASEERQYVSWWNSADRAQSWIRDR